MSRINRFVYLIAAFASLLLSVWAAAKTIVINPDAICYLLSAGAIERGLSAASHLCDQAKWPFYSILIYGLTKLSHFSVTTSAWILDGFFSLISVVTFIAIVNVFSKKTSTLIFSAIVILLAHEFNNLRVEIIRDHGFWAFYLMSFFFILQYVKKNEQWSYAVLWGVSLVIATLFRIEGLVFLLLVPFAAWVTISQPFLMRLKMFLQLNIMACLGAIALCIWIILHPEQPLGRLSEIQFQLTHGVNALVQSFQQTTHTFSAHILSVYSARDAAWITVGMFIYWYFLSVILNVTPIYAVLIIYAWIKKIAGLDRESRLIVWAYILINVLITFIFLVDNLFLSKRYLIALSLILMLWVPFALDNLWMQWHQRKWPFLLASVFVIIYGIGGIFDLGHSKKYIREGGDWLAVHASSNSKIYSNDYQLLYYSQHAGEDIFTLGKKYQDVSVILNGKWKQYDYLALRTDKNESSTLLREINIKPVVVFQNDRGDQVKIYRVKNGE